jgi:hypothetical protein
VLDDLDGTPIPAENFNSTPNFLFDNPNVISDKGFASGKLTAAGKAIVSAWAANNANAAGVAVSVTTLHNEAVEASQMVRSIKLALKRAGFTGAIRLAAKNAYSGFAPGGHTAVLGALYD